jgi:serine/threonine-protein kinase
MAMCGCEVPIAGPLAGAIAGAELLAIAGSPPVTTSLRDTLQQSLADRYTIERELGRGGMATVYVAQDVRHRRRVAVKVLHPELSAVLGPERFLKEIELTASLQHPHILPLFDSGSAEGQLFYVMPYVEGETLRGRLERERQLPIADAVRIAREVADALQYAHEHGVIHRDIKPENILLQGGHALVADFGIALAVEQAGGQRMTQTGLSLGTPTYMSPEQAAGERQIDGRTDIYSLGAITYEMLAGEPPHTGPTAQAVIAKLMTEEPRPLTVLRRAVPPHIDAAVRCALEKLPADRFATARAFADALQERPAGSTYATPAGPASGARWRTAALALGAATVLATVAAALALGTRPAPATPRPPMRFPLTFPDDASLFLTPSGTSIALSPDGTAMVYNGGRTERRLFLHRFSDLETHPLDGTVEAWNPQFSPDSRWLAFTSANTLKKLPLVGGPAITIADSVGRFAWGPNGTIVIARGVPGVGLRSGSGLWRVSENGGRVEPFTVVDSTRERAHGSPSFHPDGNTVVFTTFSGPANDSLQMAAARLSDGKVVRLGVWGGSPVATLGEFILFVRPDGTLNAVRFDAPHLRVIGDPVVVLSGVVAKAGGAGEFAVSPQGTIVYVSGAPERQLYVVDRKGNRRLLTEEARQFRTPRVSPDGRRVAVTVSDMAGGTDVWVYDIPSTTLSRVTRSGSMGSPEWTPDGRHLAWTDGPAQEVLWQPSDGSQPPERLMSGARGVLFTPRGDSAITSVGPLTGPDWKLVSLPADAAAGGRTILRSAVMPQPRLSPDGHWLAYVSDESGTREVYIQAFPGPGARVQVSSGGGTEPVWHPKGRELFYRTATMLMAASLAVTPELSVVRRDSLFMIGLPEPTQVANYDVMPDGEHFIALRPRPGGSPPMAVVNWITELRERMAVVR